MSWGRGGVGSRGPHRKTLWELKAAVGPWNSGQAGLGDVMERPWKSFYSMRATQILN